MPSLREGVRGLALGAVLRCPACVHGRLGKGMFDMYDTCPRCGAVLEVGRGEFTGALMLAWGLIGFISLFGYLALFLLGFPVWMQLAWPILSATILSVFLYRSMKGVWIGILHATGRVRADPPD